jgi:hypothetical protein
MVGARQKDEPTTRAPGTFVYRALDQELAATRAALCRPVQLADVLRAVVGESRSTEGAADPLLGHLNSFKKLYSQSYKRALKLSTILKMLTREDLIERLCGMARSRTWKVISDFEGDGGSLELACEKCGRVALVPTNGYARIEAYMGMSYFYDPITPPPDGFVPDVIECRGCHHVYGLKPKTSEADVR